MDSVFASWYSRLAVVAARTKGALDSIGTALSPPREAATCAPKRTVSALGRGVRATATTRSCVALVRCMFPSVVAATAAAVAVNRHGGVLPFSFSDHEVPQLGHKGPTCILTIQTRTHC